MQQQPPIYPPLPTEKQLPSKLARNTLSFAKELNSNCLDQFTWPVARSIYRRSANASDVWFERKGIYETPAPQSYFLTISAITQILITGVMWRNIFGRGMFQVLPSLLFQSLIPPASGVV